MQHTAYVSFQGQRSESRKLQMGTRQGGVLSPTLFNVLMNVIVSAEYPEGVTCLSYADDILLQANTHTAMQRSLDIVTEVCNRKDLVVSSEKTKPVTKKPERDKPLMLHGHKLKKVDCYKYLGVYVSGNKRINAEFNHVIQCLTSLLVLRYMYLSYNRSVIDYHTPALVCLPRNRINKLEMFRNKAARGILGCSNNLKTENMKVELNLPSISDRTE